MSSTQNNSSLIKPQSFSRKMESAKIILREKGIWPLLKALGLKAYFFTRIPNLITKMVERASFGFFVDKLLVLVPIRTDQSGVERRSTMKRVLNQAFTKPIHAIEVGTWFGLGSTNVWIQNLPQGSTLTLVDSWKPFVSKTDLEEGFGGYSAMNSLTHSAIVSTLKQIYKIESGKVRDLKINLIRGNSYEILSTFKPEIADLVYLDGSHYYADVKRDIVAAKEVMNRSFSILCGDDYEAFATQELLTFCRSNVDRDYVHHSSGISFHPGVMLAIDEELGRVNMSGGFWWVYQINGKFTTDLPQ